MHIGIFRSKVFVSVFQSEQKVIFEIIVLTRVLFVTAISTIALLRENSTNSLKVETRSDKYLEIPFLDIEIWKTVNLTKLMEHYEIRKRCISDMIINNHKHA